jgi:hypothetical protein
MAQTTTCGEGDSPFDRAAYEVLNLVMKACVTVQRFHALRNKISQRARGVLAKDKKFEHLVNVSYHYCGYVLLVRMALRSNFSATSGS